MTYTVDQMNTARAIVRTAHKVHELANGAEPTTGDLAEHWLRVGKRPSNPARGFMRELLDAGLIEEVADEPGVFQPTDLLQWAHTGA